MSPACAATSRASPATCSTPTATSASIPDVPADTLPAARMAAYRLRDAWRQLQFRRKEQGGWVRGLRFLLAR